jgi:Fe-S-cluster containining protein
MKQPDSLESQAGATIRQQQAATIQALQESRANLGVLDLARQVQRDMSAAIDSLPTKSRHACAPGCFFCCYLPVDVLAPEAFLIAAHLQRMRSASELTNLLWRLAAHSQHDFGQRACVFLAQGQCSIYDVRPLVCRGYNSLSKERCEAFYHDASIDLTGTKDRTATGLAEARQEGLIAGLKALGLEAQWYELTSAVLRALETDDGAARWARGEPVFEGCDEVFRWPC